MSALTAHRLRTRDQQAIASKKAADPPLPADRAHEGAARSAHP